MKKTFKDVCEVEFGNKNGGFELMIKYFDGDTEVRERFKIGYKKFKIESFNSGEKAGLIEVDVEG